MLSTIDENKTYLVMAALPAVVALQKRLGLDVPGVALGEDRILVVERHRPRHPAPGHPKSSPDRPQDNSAPQHDAPAVPPRGRWRMHPFPSSNPGMTEPFT